MPNEFRIGPVPEPLNRGEVIQVPIVLHLETPIKVRGIVARFHGGEETRATYTTTTSNGRGGTTTQTHTAVEVVSIVDQSFLLAGEQRRGFFASVGDSLATLLGGGRGSVMQPGDYDYLVEVRVPDHAPPTHTGKKSRIFYELQVSADIPLRRDLKALQSFTVAPLPLTVAPNPVRVCYPEDEGRGFWDKMFGPEVRIELALARDSLRIGERVDGVFQIESPSPLNVRTIRAKFVATEQSKARSHQDSYRHAGEKVELAAPGSIEGTFAERFTLTTDSLAGLPVTASGQNFSIDWFVQIELDVPWAKDPTIRAPIRVLQ